MFMDDENEYIRLKRADTVLGWLAIGVVAALVLMFAGMANVATAASPFAHQKSEAVQSRNITMNLGKIFLPPKETAPKSGIQHIKIMIKANA
jgi:hypothetical protein